MRLLFQIRYHTHSGQSLFLSGNHELLGGNDPQRALPMKYLNQECWQVTLDWHGPAPKEPIHYHYLLRNEDGSLVYDEGRDKILTPALFQEKEVVLVDSWNYAGFLENAFFTSPFKDVLLRANRREFKPPSPENPTHIFQLKAPLLGPDETLCLLGADAALGFWDLQKALPMSRSSGADILSVHVALPDASLPIAYKYGLWNLASNAFVRFEEGENRVLSELHHPGRKVVVNDGFARFPAETWKGAGVAIPVFSLRSESSFGVGEFSDLKKLADWCQQVGLKLIQILPINDTTARHTWMDSYPYSAISAFALHPMYLNLQQLASWSNKELLAELEPERKRLNALDGVEYPAVMKAKMNFIRKIYPSQKTHTFRNPDYRAFFERNRHWLVPYAVFCFLRDKYNTPDFSQWPEHSTCTPEEVEQLAAPSAPHHDEIAISYFIQFHLHQQLHDATEYAHAHGIILKGDIAIGVYRHGADAWQQPQLYQMNVQAGAPPDAFGIKGQNWGFPTYNWSRMKEDGFAWWKQRFGQMGEYFDAFRIDHILGFFRIWSIPLHAVEGILGRFVPALPVQLAEFRSRGIPFDRNRYTQPFISDQVVRETFGADAARVKQEFLQPSGDGLYTLKPEFATQRQVEKCFAKADATETNQRLKQGLFDLLSNVLLFEAGDATREEFHFRFSIETTSSFKNLDARTQAQLRDLSIDYFFRRQEDFWRREALEKLPALKRVTNMLVCGEDLGLVPACVPAVMRNLGLLSLDVQRMPKAMGQEFFRPRDAIYLSVITPSTHDMSTIRGWWEESREVTQRFFNYELGQPGVAPETCPGWVNRAIIRQHLESPAMWSIFQIQDLLGMDEKLRRPSAREERINVPANPENYWKYRMHLTLEELAGEKAFNALLNKEITQSGRG